MLCEVKKLKYLAIIALLMLSACNRIYITGTVQIISIDHNTGSIELAVKSLDTSKEPEISVIQAKAEDVGTALDSLIADYPEVLFSSASIAIVSEDIDRASLYEITQTLSEIRDISPKLSILTADKLSLEDMQLGAIARLDILKQLSATAGTELYRLHSKLYTDNVVMLPVIEKNFSELKGFTIPDISHFDRATAQLLPQNILRLPPTKKTICGTVVRIPYIDYSVRAGTISVDVGMELSGSPTDDKVNEIMQTLAVNVNRVVDMVSADDRLCEALYGQKIIRSKIIVTVQ